MLEPETVWDMAKRRAPSTRRPRYRSNVLSRDNYLKIRCVQLFSTFCVLNQEIVVTLPVTGLKRGKVSFDFDKENTFIAAYGGQDLLQKATPLTVVIE